MALLWDASSGESPPYDALNLIGASVLFTVVGVAAIAGAMYIANRHNIHWREPKTYRSVPAWVQRAILWLGLTAYFYDAVLPWVTKRPVVGIGQLLGRLLVRILSRKSTNTSVD